MLQIYQLIACLQSSVNQQGLLADKKREGRCSDDYFFFTVCGKHFSGLIEALDSKGILGAYHLARKSGNFDLKSNGKVIFRKFRLEIVEYLQRYSSFSVRN